MKKIAIALLRPIRLLLNLLSFLQSIFFLVMCFHKDTRMKELLLLNLKELVAILSSKSNLTKTVSDSEAIYQEYGDREIISYYKDADFCLVNNQLTIVSVREQRLTHLAYIYEEIDRLLLLKDIVKIIEVGCGNCLNIIEILEKYGSKVEVHGIDVTSGRIEVAKHYFKEKLAPAKLTITSITTQTQYADNEFDLVYSMFCLEQIAYEAHAAVREMYRITSGKVVMLEPVFENGTVLQKTYLMVADHTRILLKSILEQKLPLVKNEILNLQFNPCNQSSILVIDKNQH